MMRNKADLHLHSNYSDGDMTPSDLVRFAKESGLSVISLTDHDCIDGLKESEEACKENGVQFVSGVELSSKEHREIHILGYNIDYTNEEFIKELSRVRNLRHERNLLILEALKKNHVIITEEEINKKNTPGRKEIARIMIEKRYVKNYQEAFDKYLGFGACAYVDAKRPSPEEAIHMINKYGGMAVLAHPFKVGLDDRALPEFIKRLTSYGLKGVEVFYTSHSEDNVAFLKQITKENHLFMSGGSDFHDKTGMIELGNLEYGFDDRAFKRYLKR